MMGKQKHVTELAVGIWLATFAAASAELPRLLSYQVKNHLGENATVCGIVVSARYLESTRAPLPFSISTTRIQTSHSR